MRHTNGRAPEDGPEFAAEARLHEHVEVARVLEGAVELDDEVAVGLLHDLLLGHDVLLLARLDDLRLLHLLQGVRLRRVRADLDQLDAAEAAHAQRRDRRQVLQFHVREPVVDPATQKKKRKRSNKKKTSPLLLAHHRFTKTTHVSRSVNRYKSSPFNHFRTK